MSRVRSRTTRSIVILGLLGALTAACSDAESPTLTVTAPAAPSAEGSAASSAPAAASPSSVPSASALPVVATRAGSDIDGAKVEVSLNSVAVAGPVMTVTWTARNAGEKDWTIGSYFFTGSFFEGPKYTGEFAEVASSRHIDDADGVYVLDRTNARRYLTGRDKAMRCACSSELYAVNLTPGGSAVLEAQYQAPPQSVTEVDVVIPNVGTFRAVPVTR